MKILIAAIKKTNKDKELINAHTKSHLQTPLMIAVSLEDLELSKISKYILILLFYYLFYCSFSYKLYLLLFFDKE